MQIQAEYLYAAMGAVGALAIARFRGWLNVPFLDGGQAAKPPPPVSSPQYQPVSEPVAQSYSAVIEIPHQITVTPQQRIKQ